MEAYSKFAEVYDLFTQDIPYEQWCNYITDLLHKYGIMDGIVLELGCGTGNLTKRLASKGYDMIGVDNSEAMLEVAMEKERTNPQGILYLLQDMREFELYGTVRAVVSVCDSMNYLLEEGELEQVFRLVNNYLDPKGIFIFDLKTDYYYRNDTGDQIFGENQEDSSFIWENYYYEEEKINEYALTIFTKEEGDLYRKSEEVHYQRAYDLNEVCQALARAGMEFIAAYEEGSNETPKETSERIYIVARESGK